MPKDHTDRLTDDEWKSRATGVVQPPISEAPGVVQPPSSSQVLCEADRVIHGERAASYGSAEDSFARIAALWSVHLGAPVDAYDVAIMMTLMKCARAATDVKRDTFVDIAGYAALAERCAAKAGRA